MKLRLVTKEWLSYLAIFFLIFSSIAYAKPTTNLEQATASLVGLSQKAKLDKHLTDDAIAQAIATAKARRDALVQALQQNGAASVAKYLLSADIRKNLPNQVQAYTETNVSDIEGTLEIRAALLKGKGEGEAIQYIVKQNDGRMYYLHFADQAPNLTTDAMVRIKQAMQITTANGSFDLIAYANQVTMAKDVAIPSSFGQQRTVVFLLNFQDSPTQPFTIDQIRQTMTQVNDMYYEFSYNQTTVVSDVYGWYTVPVSQGADCNTITSAMSNYAATAAQRAGINLGSYQHRVFIFPNVRQCAWAGLGTVGGSPSNAWINGYNHPYYTSHELGHNLGLYHAAFYQCNGTTNTGTCSRVEYGDRADVMGQGIYAHFNAFQKDRLGWLNYSASPPITTVTASGTYNIDAYETKNNNVKALKVLKNTLADGSHDYYYLEFRTSYGFDNILSTCGTNCDYTRGVLVHQANDNSANTSYLLDMSPTDGNSSIVTLLPGKTFADTAASNGGVKITVNSVSGSTANVTVTFGSGGDNPPPTSCVRANPTVTVTPTTTQWSTPGGSAFYTLSLKNNDSSACPASSFSLRSTITPATAAVNANLCPQAATLSPGQSTSINLGVMSNTQATRTIYSINVNASNNAATTYNGSAVASFGLQ